MTIDLGNVSLLPREVLEPPAPTAGAGTRRMTLSAMLTILLLALVGSSGGRPPNPLPLVASFPGGINAQMLITGSRAVIATDDPDGTSRLTAYALPDGHRVWDVPLLDFQSEGYLIVGSSVVLQGFRSGAGSPRQVEAVDLATGMLRWSLPAQGVVSIEAGLLTYEQPLESLPDLSDSPTDISLIDPDTGHARWTVRVPGSCATSYSDDFAQLMQRGLVELCPGTGQLSVLDLRTGQRVAQRHLDLHAADDAIPLTQRPIRLLYVGAAVLVMTGDFPNAIVTALRATDLEPLWSGLPYPSGTYIYTCAPYICEDQSNGTVTIAADPQTGVEVPLPPGHTETTPPMPAQFAAAHGNSEMVIIPDDQNSITDVTAGISFAPIVEEGTSVLMPGSPITGSIGTWILTEVASRSGAAIRPIALLHGVGDSCQAIGGYVVCITTNGRIALWRLPSWSVS